MARSIECECTYNFTCNYCCRNAKPWFYTLSDGSAIYDTPFQGQRIKAEEEKADGAKSTTRTIPARS